MIYINFKRQQKLFGDNFLRKRNDTTCHKSRLVLIFGQFSFLFYDKWCQMIINSDWSNARHARTTMRQMVVYTSSFFMIERTVITTWLDNIINGQYFYLWFKFMISNPQPSTAACWLTDKNNQNSLIII